MKMQHIINSRPGTGSQIRQLRASAAPARGRKWLAAAAVRGVAPGGAGGRGDADGGPLPDAARGLEPEALPLLASQVWREAQLQLGEEQAAGGWGGSQGEGPGQASQAPGAVALAGDAAASGRQQPRMGRGPPVGSDVTMDDAGGGGQGGQGEPDAIRPGDGPAGHRDDSGLLAGGAKPGQGPNGAGFKRQLSERTLLFVANSPRWAVSASRTGRTRHARKSTTFAKPDRPNALGMPS